MEWDRGQFGLALAAFMLIGAGIAATEKASGAMWFLIGAAVLLLALAFAPTLPLLHSLPVIGLPRIEMALTVEDTGSWSTAEPMVDQVLRIGLKNEGPREFKRTRLNILVPLPHNMRPSDAGGNPEDPRAGRLPDTSEQLIAGRDSQAWSERIGDVDEESLLIHYRLHFTEPGTWPVRVKLASPSLYRRRELVKDIEVEAVARDT